MSNTHESQSVGEQSAMGTILEISASALNFSEAVLAKLRVLNLSRRPILL